MSDERAADADHAVRFEYLSERTPAAATLGRTLLEVDTSSQEVHLRYEASPDFANRHGTVSGGFLAAMLDSACAVALLAVLRPEAVPVTTGLSVSFVKPAPVGSLRATARVTEVSHRAATCDGTLSSSDGTIVASATAVFRILQSRND
jgi:uncharacterized protein (TIGR00369 family)